MSGEVEQGEGPPRGVWEMFADLADGTAEQGGLREGPEVEGAEDGVVLRLYRPTPSEALGARVDGWRVGVSGHAEVEGAVEVAAASGDEAGFGFGAVLVLGDEGRWVPAGPVFALRVEEEDDEGRYSAVELPPGPAETALHVLVDFAVRTMLAWTGARGEAN